MLSHGSLYVKQRRRAGKRRFMAGLPSNWATWINIPSTKGPFMDKEWFLRWNSNYRSSAIMTEIVGRISANGEVFAGMLTAQLCFWGTCGCNKLELSYSRYMQEFRVQNGVHRQSKFLVDDLTDRLWFYRLSIGFTKSYCCHHQHRNPLHGYFGGTVEFPCSSLPTQ